MEILIRPEIVFADDSSDLARRAETIFREAAMKAVASSGRFAAALSGGSTPTEMFSLLASCGTNESLPWDRVHLFWADERCVPASDTESNFGMAEKLLLSNVPIPDSNIHRIRGEAAPEAEAMRYENEIKSFFNTSNTAPFDLVLLGLGEDGHTASLFPGSPVLSVTEHLVAVSHSPKGIEKRITLTLPALNSAGLVVFLVTGESKAQAVQKVIIDGVLPAAMVNPLNGRLLWLLDTWAASRISL